MSRFLLLFLALLFLARLGFGRNITTVSGTTFHDVVVTGVERTGLDIRFNGGTAFVQFADLPREAVAGFFETGNGDAEAAPPALPGAVAPRFDPAAENAADAVAPGPDVEFVPQIEALDGSVFQDVVIISIERTGLRFRHRNGVGFLDFSLLPEQLRQRFGFSEARYADGKAWRAQRAHWSAPMQRSNATAAATRQAEVPGPRGTLGSPMVQPPQIFSNPGFRSGGFAPAATGAAQRGVSSSGSFSGSGSVHVGAGAVHVSGSRR